MHLWWLAGSKINYFILNSMFLNHYIFFLPVYSQFRFYISILVLILEIYPKINCNLISTILPTSLLNYDLINVQKCWKWSVLINFIENTFGMLVLDLSWRQVSLFSIIFSKFSEYLEMIKDSPGFLLDHEGFRVLYIWEVLLYFDHCENTKKYFPVFLFCLEILNLMFLCIVDIHSRTWIT